MPFEAGAIVGHMVLDRSKWSKDVQAVQKETKTLSGTIQKNSAQFRKMGMAMTAAGGAIVGAVGAMVSNYVKAGDEVHKMALRTGFGTESLSELKYAAEISGATLSDVEKGVKKMSKTIVDASAGMATYVRAFDRIGLSAEELMKLSPEQQFDTIAKAIAGVESPTLRAATAQEIFGRAGTQLLPLFAEGEKGLEALRQKARDMGIVFDQEAANKAARLNDAMTTLKESFKGVFISIADKLVPVITQVVEKIGGVITKIRTWMDAHPKLSGLITKVVLVLGGLMTVLGPILMVLPALASGFAILTGPIGLVAAAVAGLIALATLIIANWEPITKFFSNLWDGIKGFFVDAYKGIKDGLAGFIGDFIKLLAGLGEMAVRIIADIVRGIISRFTGAFDKVKELATKLKDGVVGIFNKLKEKVVGASIIPMMVDMTLMQFGRLDEGVQEKVSSISEYTRNAFEELKQNVESSFEYMVDNLTGALMTWSEGTASIFDIMRGVISGFVGDVIHQIGRLIIAESLASVKSWIAKKAEALASGIASVFKAIPFPFNIAAAAALIATIGALFAKIKPKKMQRGGRLEAGEPAVVGERGPELWVPRRPGEVVPLREAVGRPSVTIHFAPVFQITTLDAMTAREVTRTRIAPELLEMFRAHIMQPEFKKALGIET
ncbi:MAG: phage tail tape measure protein [Desulfobacterales bacterium]|nr:phage tail tape measure protein [Desulfobacterales bacterium]